jgi:ligand-binding sensor domain-containing protein
MKRYYNIYFLFFIFVILSVVLHGCEQDSPDVINGFPAGKVLSLCTDESGIIWAGTDAGLISFWQGIWMSYNNISDMPSGDIIDIACQQSGGVNELYLATLNGLYVVCSDLNSISSVISYKKGLSGLADNKTNAVLADAFNALWFATPAGLNIFRNNTWYDETGYGDLITNPVLALDGQNDGWIFAGTKGFGVARFRYDESIDGISGASYYNTDWSGLPSDTILSVYVDHDNNQWFGTPSGVACHTDWETRSGWKVYTEINGLINNRVFSICKDMNGRVWFGTAEGISCLDGNIWTSYTLIDGLVHQKVNDIIEDKDGLLWFATDGGISCLNGTDWKSYFR